MQGGAFTGGCGRKKNSFFGFCTNVTVGTIKVGLSRSSPLHPYDSIQCKCKSWRSIAFMYSLPLALHRLDVIRHIRWAYRNTRSTQARFMVTALFRAAPCSFHYCGAKSSCIRGQNKTPSLPPVGTFPRSLTSIFRTSPPFVNVPGAFTERRGCETQQSRR